MRLSLRRVWGALMLVQRGTRHAWSNRSGRPCVLAISSHDAVEDRA